MDGNCLTGFPDEICDKFHTEVVSGCIILYNIYKCGFFVSC